MVKCLTLKRDLLKKYKKTQIVPSGTKGESMLYMIFLSNTFRG